MQPTPHVIATRSKIAGAIPSELSTLPCPRLALCVICSSVAGEIDLVPNVQMSNVLADPILAVSRSHSFEIIDVGVID